MKTYGPICAQFYELQEHSDGPHALPFYLEYAKNAGGPILEPMCGAGRFLIPIAQQGLDIEGFDASQDMLELLLDKFPEASVSKAYVQEFNSPRIYKLIFIPYGSFGIIINRMEAIKSLQNLYNLLEIGGTLLLEIETEASLPENLNTWCRGTNHKSVDTQIVLDVYSTYDKDTQIFQSNCTYTLSNKNLIETENEIFYMYLYKSNELDLILKNIGFTKITKYCDYNKNIKIDSKTPIIIYECIK